MAGGRKPKKKKTRKVSHGVIHIHATFNNTVLTLTDTEGNVLAWSSGGLAGFKGTKKGTPYAAQQAADLLARKALEEVGVKTVEIYTKGPGSGRDTAIRTLQASGLKILNIEDVTPLPHNGCRPKKAKRG
ncbi:MAG: 30S ribosomal protein S11 [bacterium JZ-2024 1]